MALSDFLGKTPEITIIDFFIEHKDMSYDFDEITEYTGLPASVVNETMVKLIRSKVVGQDRDRDYQGYYTLKDNDIGDGLTRAVQAHFFINERGKRK